MAGPLDALTGLNQYDPELVRQQLLDKQQQDFQTFGKGVARNRREQGVADILGGLQGLAQAGAFGDKAQKWITQGVESDPRLQQVQANVKLMEGLQGIKADPASSDWAKQAAELAHKAGRPEVALQLSQVYGERQKSETALAAKTKQTELENARATYSSLPQQLKLSAIAEGGVGYLDTVFPDLTTANKEKIVADARNSLSTMDALNQQKLNEAKQLITNDVDKGAIASVNSFLTNHGIVPGTFGGLNQQQLDAFSSLIAGGKEKAKAAARKAGQPFDENQYYADSWKKLNESGAVKLRPEHGFGNGNVMQSFDVDKVTQILSLKSGGGADSNGSKDTGAAAPKALAPKDQQALDWANANPDSPYAAQIKQKLGR